MECLAVSAVPDDLSPQQISTKSTLTRYTTRDCEKRVSSPSASEKVVITECRWVAPPNSAPGHLVCALNDGEVCLLDTNSLATVPLLGGDKRASSPATAPTDAKKEEKRPSHRREKIGLDCHSFGASSALVLVAADRKVEALLIDPTGTDAKHAQKGAPANIAEYPATGEGLFGAPVVRFNSDGLSFFVHISFTPADQLSKQFIMVGAQQGGGQCRVTLPWTDLSSLSDPVVAAELTSHDILCIDWWSAEEVVCVWSNGLVQLFDVAHEKLTAQGFVMGEADELVHYTLATVCPPTGGADSVGLLGVVLSHNIASTFGVRVLDNAKRPRSESFSNRHLKQIEFVPTEKTYCSDEIPIREISLFPVRSPVLCVVLESGAIIFLDATELCFLAHKALKRLYEPSLNLYEEEQETRPSRQFFSAVVGRPFSMCLVERNTVVVMKAD